MRYQNTKYSCGAAAVVNALKCFGKNVSERYISAHAGTNPKDGTGYLGIVAALKWCGCKAEPRVFKKVKYAKAYLDSRLAKGGPVILDGANGQHWITVIGLMPTGYYITIDPQRGPMNERENGVRLMDAPTLARYWLDDRITATDVPGTPPRYFVIAVSQGRRSKWNRKPKRSKRKR